MTTIDAVFFSYMVRSTSQQCIGRFLSELDCGGEEFGIVNTWPIIATIYWADVMKYHISCDPGCSAAITMN